MEVRFKRDIYKTSRFKLSFFMYEPKMTYTEDGVFSPQFSPSLTLQYTPPSERYEDKDAFRESMYRIGPHNLYRTAMFFNNVLEWFSDPNKQDLFLINDNDELVFNADYKDLYEIVRSGFTNADTLKAIPSVVEFNSKKMEGAILYINKIANSIPITVQDIATILSILKSFSFEQEIMLSITLLEYCTKRNRVVPADKFDTSGGGSFNGGYTAKKMKYPPTKTPFT